MSLWGMIGGIAGSIGEKQIDIQQAKSQRSWLGEMSGTAHRREVADLRAAGLNPILSARTSGASTPGSAGQSTAGSGISRAMSTGVANAIAMKQAMANVDRTNAETGMTRVQLELQRDMLQYYRENPAVRNAMRQARLYNESGLPRMMSPLGFVSGGIESAYRKFQDWVKESARNVRRNKPEMFEKGQTKRRINLPKIGSREYYKLPEYKEK